MVLLQKQELISQDASHPTLIKIVLWSVEGWPIRCRRSPRVVAIASAEVVVTVVQGVRAKLIVIIVVAIIEVPTGGLVIISTVVPYDIKTQLRLTSRN